MKIVSKKYACRALFMICAVVVAGAFYFVWLHYENALETQVSHLADGHVQLRVMGEYEPVRAVLLSTHLLGDNTMAHDLIKAIATTGTQLIFLGDETALAKPKGEFLKDHGLEYLSQTIFEVLSIAHDSMWIRDFGPVPISFRSAYSKDTKVLAFADMDFRPNEESLNGSLAYQIAIYTDSSVINVPLINDGGNFLSNGQWCLLTNTFEVPNPSLDASAILKSRFGCKEVMIFEEFPHEHIDMWAKFVSDRVIFVNDFIDDPDLDEDSKRLDQILDKAANRLQEHFRVVRVPMLKPFGLSFRTYVNSLLINGVAILPSFRREEISKSDYPDQSVIKSTEAQVEQLYKDQGYKVVWVPGDFFAAAGGSFHCIAITLPVVKKG